MMTFGTSFPISSSNYFIDSVKNDIMMKELFGNPKFQKWINFWESKIPAISNFVIENTDTIERKFSSRIDLKKWFNKIKLREFTLDFSPGKDYVTDIYSDVVFEYINDSIYVMGRDIDPAFAIVNIKDSTLYPLTLGPYSFFDESIWLSDSTCYLLGFAFDDSRQNVSEAYSRIIILEWNFNKDVLIKYRSNKFLFNKELMSFQTYMDYLYPYFYKSK
jgi:hypothetical protein